MNNFFSFNFGLPFCMNNWVMPILSFPNAFPLFQMPLFNITNSWFNIPYQNFFTPQISYPSDSYQSQNVKEKKETKPKEVSVWEAPKPNKTKKTTHSNTNYKYEFGSKKVDTSYSKMSRDAALKKAKKDSRLEELKGGQGWSISENSFITDIPYARKHTGKILSFISRQIKEDIVVTSALGTNAKNSPHIVSKSYATHHNAENPKLDIRTNGHPAVLQKKLKETGFFSRVSVEPDHLDIQIKPEIYAAIESGMNLDNILAYAKENNLNKYIA